MPAPGRSWTNPRTGAWLTWTPEGDDGVIERVIKPRTGKADAQAAGAPDRQLRLPRP